MHFVLALSAVILLVACTTEEAPSAETESQEISESDLSVGGQPSDGDIAALAAAGYRTVVNLRSFEEGDLDAERASVRQAGMTYVAIPFRSAKLLQDAHFDLGRQWLRDDTARPLYMHCASGNRVGALYIAFRVLDEGADFDQAVAEARSMGLRSDELVVRAKDYVSRHQR
ncbi:MAG: protein tyrosine phosphatase family protein [Planctomycetes bacterium]|nr:protein tyrosine phosphatase family protein [Planctomycetota bacterium]